VQEIEEDHPESKKKNGNKIDSYSRGTKNEMKLNKGGGVGFQ